MSKHKADSHRDSRDDSHKESIDRNPAEPTTASITASMTEPISTPYEQTHNRFDTTRSRPSRNLRWPIAIALVLIVGAALWALMRRGDHAKGTLKSADAAAVTGTDSAKAAAGDSVLRLDSAAQRLAGIQLLTISPSSTGVLTANGTITYDANRVSVVSSRVEARVVSVRADLGQQVPADGLLATLESSDVGQTRGDLERARATVDVARRNYEREKRLFAESISPEKEMLDAEAAYRTAQADLNSASSKLRAVGAAGGQGATFSLVTPVGGTVVERNASPGQVVGPTTNLFTVADLSRVWITVDVYEDDLSRVHDGAKATVIANALPNRAFAGIVTYAGGIVDSASHTFKVRVAVDNAGRALRPGMFAQVRIETPAVRALGATGDRSGGASTSASATSETPTITVPEMAVQEVNGKQIVFVAGRTPGEFVARSVTAGPRAGNGSIVITHGLTAGDRIAVQGAFQLKAELTKASFGEGE